MIPDNVIEPDDRSAERRAWSTPPRRDVPSADEGALLWRLALAAALAVVALAAASSLLA